MDCGLRTADYGPRTWYKTRTRHKMRTKGFFIYLFMFENSAYYFQAFAMDLWPVDLCEFITELKLPEVQTH